MRPLWIVAAIACGVLVLAGVASASMRDEFRALFPAVATVTPVADDASSPLPAPSTSAPESATPSPTPSETTASENADNETEAQSNHGAKVSQVARDKEAVATKTLPNGKTITNHGMAVSAVARDKAVTAMPARNGGSSHGKGHNGNKGSGKSGR